MSIFELIPIIVVIGIVIGVFLGLVMKYTDTSVSKINITGSLPAWLKKNHQQLLEQSMHRQKLNIDAQPLIDEVIADQDKHRQKELKMSITPVKDAELCADESLQQETSSWVESSEKKVI